MIFLTLKKKDTLIAILIQNKMSILAKFIQSNTDWKKCPDPKLPEYALIGRSNVGKSSLINMLTERKSLAKISSTPGKTQLINHFLINNSLFFVDLPGYGWAKTSKKNRESWDLMTKKYLLNSNKIVLIFILIDIRLRPQKIDIDYINFIGKNNLPLNYDDCRKRQVKLFESVLNFFTTKLLNCIFDYKTK